MRAPGFAAWQTSAGSRLPVYGYTVSRVYPHDPGAFTQGLQCADGCLYEGTGLQGRSSIRRVRLETGEVLQQRVLPDPHFGEGIVLWKSELMQLTWHSGKAFVYDRSTFALTRVLDYRGEGWGLTHDGSSLLMSDGTARLRVLDPETFAERRRIDVTADGAPLSSLNDLAFVNGEIFANVWQTEWVARISLLTGEVTGWIDFSGLLSETERRGADVMNGIAYDAGRDRLFVTGKLWPKVFEVRTSAPSAPATSGAVPSR